MFSVSFCFGFWFVCVGVCFFLGGGGCCFLGFFFFFFWGGGVPYDGLITLHLAFSFPWLARLFQISLPMLL